ncbi:MAG: decarboxylase [Acidimicrobiia bacterium]|nr:decarboxylase [Acidimicrobiia bacterium]
MSTGSTLTIDDVNSLDLDGFVTAFGQVFEASPALAKRAWRGHPFADRAALVQAFHRAADELDEGAALALLRAHPQLTSTELMTSDSEQEQRSAGLTTLDDGMRARIQRANARYLDRFGIPFIIAVRGLGPADIALALAERLGHDQSEERAIALGQVKRIAELRITHMVTL